MAKLIREYEDGIEKRLLIFRGEEISYHMKSTRLGTEGDAPCFYAQLEEKFPDLEKDLLEQIDMLDCEHDPDEIFEMLEILGLAE